MSASMRFNIDQNAAESSRLIARPERKATRAGRRDGFHATKRLSPLSFESRRNAEPLRVARSGLIATTRPSNAPARIVHVESLRCAPDEAANDTDASDTNIRSRVNIASE
jgi:hypothetical protein